MLRYLPTVLVVGLLVYCLVDCAQAPAGSVRTLPKVAWVVVILVLPLLGSIGWLLAGRPSGPAHRGGPPRRPQGPDDDPDFLRGLDGGPSR